MKYVILDFPLESIHKDAFKAHEAANCAKEQGKYWEMLTRLITHQKDLGLTKLPGHAEAIQLDVAAFEQCIESGKHAAEIRQDMSEGAKVGVRGTPSFLIGLSQPNNAVYALKMIRGAQPFPRFKQAIDELLASKNK